MIGRRGAVGFALLCALAFSAFAAPNAMALKGTTAFTCEHVAVGAEFSDEHCTKAGTGEGWKHSTTALSGNTQITVSNTETQGKVSYPKLKSVIAGVEFELEAGGFMSCINKTSLENKEVGGQMVAEGENCGLFYNVVVNKPKNCSVKGKEVTLTEGGKGKTSVTEPEAGKQKMAIEFTPPKEKPFASFTLEGAECALNGKTIEVTGSAKANGTTEEAKLDGATIKFTTAETEETLKVGAIKAKFEAVFTPRMIGEVGKEENPIVLTTTTT